ncbi:MAG: L-rhamnose isomerase [Verrucomicrobiales bacterium]|nr:L-rhamnose isomerase [Verrucomicrobiales bacterium]
MNQKNFEAANKLAKECYAEMGVNVAAALKKLAVILVSLFYWRGDDVGGIRIEKFTPDLRALAAAKFCQIQKWLRRHRPARRCGVDPRLVTRSPSLKILQ